MSKNVFFIAAVLLVTSCSSDKAADSSVSNEKSTAEEVTTDKASTTQEQAAIDPSATAGSSDNAEHVQAAKKAIKQFAGELKAELVSAMKTGGPVNAIDVCSTKAGPIAEKVSAEQGVTLTRVSMKNRHANNVPNEWQQKVLTHFEARKMEGQDVAKKLFIFFFNPL